VGFADDGTAIAAWTKEGGGIEAARRPPGGSFGSIQPVSGESPEQTRLAVGPEGRALLSWTLFNGSNYVVEASSAEPGGSFAAPAKVSAPGLDAQATAPAVGPGNVAFVAWEEGEGFDLRAAAAAPGGPLATATAPAASQAFPIEAQFSEDGGLMLLWSAGETAPFSTMAAVRTPAGAFGPPEPVSEPGENTSTRGLGGDGKGDFLALYHREEEAGNSTLRVRSYDGQAPLFTSLSVPKRARTGKRAPFSATAFDTLGTPVSIRWKFGDKRSADGASVTHTYRRTGGRRTVEVSATDAAGNTRTEKRTIVVKDVTPVVISGARFRPAKLAAAGGSSAGAARAKRASTLRYRLSEPAKVRITFERGLPGRHRGKRCLAPPRAPGGRRCTRFVRVRGAKPLARSGRTGSNSLKFTGRLGGKLLPPGRYRATLVATDTGGLRSKPATAGLRIVGR
jgi:hypothetical protein